MNVRGAARSKIRPPRIINSEGEIRSIPPKLVFRIYHFSAWLAEEHVIIDRKEKATSKTSICTGALDWAGQISAMSS